MAAGLTFDLVDIFRLDFAPYEWPVTFLLVVPHGQEGQDNGKPVQVVRDHRAVCRRISPSKNGIENTPATTATELLIAALRSRIQKCG